MAMKHVSDYMVCVAVDTYRQFYKTTDVPYPYETLAKFTGQPEKVCYRAMERALRRGYLEYGVSLRTGWLTEKGKALIATYEKSLQPG